MSIHAGQLLREIGLRESFRVRSRSSTASVTMEMRGSIARMYQAVAHVSSFSDVDGRPLLMSDCGRLRSSNGEGNPDVGRNERAFGVLSTFFMKVTVRHARRHGAPESGRSWIFLLEGNFPLARMKLQ
jgi:hypothetical protein